MDDSLFAAVGGTNHAGSEGLLAMNSSSLPVPIQFGVAPPAAPKFDPMIALDSSLPSSLPNDVWLDYPHDFLNPKTGAGPKNADEAVFLWNYRKNRPASASDVD